MSITPQFRFYLDNNLVSDPLNWDDFTETIERDEVLKGLLPKYEIKLTFDGLGYSYLRGLRKLAGYCNRVEIKIDGKNSTELEGYIFISDCRFNLTKCTVECEVFDNNYEAFIYNNKNIKIYLDSTLSKNLSDIPVCVSKTIHTFRPSNGSDTALIKAYPVWNCFKYFIDFMSDGKMDFESDFLDLLQTQVDNPQRSLTITTGALLRSHDTISPNTSFQELFSEINKKYPISFTILKQTNGRLLFKIENNQYFYGQASGIKIDNIQDLTESFNNEILYSEVNIGGPTVDYNASIHSVPDTIKMLFANENYYFQTRCNIDRKLDLTGVYISDSNIIEELVATNTTNNTYDENVFFLETTYSSGITGNVAIKKSVFGSGLPYYYNWHLTNIETAKNLAIYADLLQYINSNAIGFMATATTTYVFPFHKLADYTVGLGGILVPLGSAEVLLTYEDDFTPPNNDPGANYSLTSKYTAPSDGHYRFQAQRDVHIETDLVHFGPNAMLQLYFYLRKFDSSGTLLEEYSISVGPSEFNHYKVFNSEATFLMEIEHSFFMQATDYVETFFKWISLPHCCYNSSGHYIGGASSVRVSLFSGTLSFFKTLATASNGTLISGNSLLYNAERLEFKKPIASDSYSILKTDLSTSLQVNADGVHNKTAWIRKITRKYSTGECTWELISNLENT